MLVLNEKIKKLVHDETGFFFVFENPNNQQLIYQTINETAFDIMAKIANGTEIASIINELKNKYKNDNNVEQKVHEFIERLETWNLIERKDEIINKVVIINNIGIVTPRYCIIEISSNCLLNCTHCYLGKKETLYLETGELNHLIYELSDLGVDYIQLTGGEPLLHPKINEILDVLDSKKIRLSITTSGYLKKNEENIISKIASYKGSCFLQVSVDGLEKTHDTIRGVKGCFSKTTSFIKKAILSGIEIHVATVVQRRNYKELESIIVYMKDLGVKRIRLTSLMDEGFATKDDIIDSSIINDRVKEFSRKYGNDNFDILSSEDSLDLLENRRTPNCGCGSQLLTIDTKLNVYNCVLYRVPLFNIQKIKFREGLRNYSIKNYNIKAPNSYDCKGCEKINYCKGCITLGLREHKKKPCIWGKKWNL